MKKIIILFFALFSFTYYLNASVYIDETFSYPVTNLASESSWTTAGTLTTGSGRNIITSALTYSNNGKTYILSGIGNTLNSDISAATDYKSYKPFNTSAVNSGAVYLSFIYKAGVAQSQTNSEVMGLADGTSQGPRLWAGKGINNTANYRFGLTRGITTSAAIIWGTTEYSDINQTILVIIKYDFATTTASVFINPELGNTVEPPANIIDNTTSTFRTQLNNLWFRSQGSSAAKYNVGGIRVASTWAEVIADRNTPKLATPVTGIATNITESGFTANWSPVVNAISYNILVYKGTSLFSTTNASGQSTSSTSISGLTGGTEYTFKVAAIGNGADYADSDLSDASAVFSTTGVSSVEKIITNFGDGTWGTIATTALTTGNYPSSSINGFNLTKAYLYTGSLTCPTGESHTNRIAVDRSSYGSAVEFPILKTVGEVEIHAVTGTAGNSFRLEEFVNNVWETIGTYTTIKTPDSVYIIPLVRNSETKLRIANNTSSGLYIYKIATRTLQETIDLNLQSSSPTEGEICFSNLKKTIILKFNKNIVAQTGTFTLNGVDIPFSSCTVSGNTVTIPVTLTTTTGSNKNYTFTVSAGAFGEAGNPTNLSKALTINFQTIKSVAYPTNYNAQIDVVYKNVNSANCRMDIYYPTDAITPVPVVINMHGGGWVSGAKEEQGGFNMYFNRGYAVANVEYRMRLETLAPAAVEDVRGAMQYILNHAEELNIDRNKII
ncbi:MAG TPA: alpha/beta hydrolase fold domain-containing protein, partial [Paludibacter sp.]|nr:alpha/beta hydrolase fold domain-containing protein [Paludibacter sp.]